MQSKSSVDATCEMSAAEEFENLSLVLLLTYMDHIFRISTICLRQPTPVLVKLCLHTSTKWSYIMNISAEGHQVNAGVDVNQ